MNAKRRAELTKARGMIEEAASIVRQCAEEEQEFYDNMPESLQNGEKGETASSAADGLGEAADNLESVIDPINEAMGE